MKRLAVESPLAQQRRGADIETDLSVSLERIAEGGEERLRLSRPERCPSCHGSGGEGGRAPRRCDACQGTGHLTHGRREDSPPQLLPHITPCSACYGRGRLIDQPCTRCCGTGSVEREEVLMVAIPRGVGDGAVLRIAGKGRPSADPGGHAGDLLVRVRSQRDRRFVRHGADLCHRETIALTDAVLGATRAVPTLVATAQMRIPPGTQPGTVLHLPGHGLPVYGSRRTGELQVQLCVQVPDRLTTEEQALYERLRALAIRASADGEADAQQAPER